MVARAAVRQGAVLWDGSEALGVERDGPWVRSVVVGRPAAVGCSPEAVATRYLVVATGASTRFSQRLGVSRDTHYPMGLAFRGYCASERHGDPYIEIDMEIRDRAGGAMAGYGWVFPAGDGSVNLGVGILTTYRGWRAVKARPLVDAFLARTRERWSITDAEMCGMIGGRLPLGGSMSPVVAGNVVVVGDAAGLNNPFIGEGIGYAYETGRLAAIALDGALGSRDPSALRHYAAEVDRRYRRYFQVGNVFARLIGHPRVMDGVTRLGMSWEPLMNTVLPVMDNSLRGRHLGAPELLYAAARTVVAPLPRRWAPGAPQRLRPRRAPDAGDRPPDDLVVAGGDAVGSERSRRSLADEVTLR
jgi:flavin-dependent dehydrogenase